MAILDTTVIVDIIRANPNVKKVLDKLEATQDEPKIGSPTVQELVKGAYFGRSPQTELDRLNQIFKGLSILPFTATTAKIAGHIQAELEKSGKPIDIEDIQIAAIAKAADERIITRNQKYFSLIKGLIVESY